MNNISPLKIKSGFTLIEVLVASLILFSSIAVISLIYKGAYLTSVKSTAHITVSGAIPIVLANIKDEIRVKGDNDQVEQKGRGEAWGVQYNWRAELLKFKSAPNLFDPDLGKDVQSPQKYKLWQVNLNVRYKSLKQSYTYNEISWNEK